MDRNRRRKFGQNFLCNDILIRAIASDLPLTPNSQVLEIGPGHGAITAHMLNTGAHVTAVEIDEKCVSYLNTKKKDGRLDRKRLDIVNQNFMDFDLEGFVKEHPKCWIAGNLPYNMGTPILRKILPHMSSVRGMMAMLQYEVAKRMYAEPGTKDFGFLTVLVQSWADVSLLLKVGPQNFKPRPNVMSATIMITPRKNALGTTPEFLGFLGLCFAQKRKMITNTLGVAYPKETVREALKSLDLDEKIRAEAIQVEKFHQLFEILGIPEGIELPK